MFCAQALPSGDLEMLLQQHPMMNSGMGRAPSFGMAKLESMELPDAVAAVVRLLPCFPFTLSLGGKTLASYPCKACLYSMDAALVCH